MKSKFVTLFFSLIPGVGHLYLGLMNRGLQFLLTFATAIIVMAFLEVGGLFVFLPVIWFYSLFDALQQHQLIQEGIYEDRPLPFWSKLYFSHKWIAYSLIGVGAYIIFERLLRFVSRFFLINYHYYLNDLRSFLVAAILIFIGYRLLLSTRTRAKKTTDLLPEGESTDEK